MNDDHAGYGQVLASIKPNPLYLAVFEPLFPRHPPSPLEEIRSSPILVLANSIDAKIWHGHWPIVGRIAPKLERVPFPAYVTSVDRRDDYFLMSYNGIETPKGTAFRSSALREAHDGSSDETGAGVYGSPWSSFLGTALRSTDFRPRVGEI